MGLHDNLLLVEGKDDQRVIPELIERAGVPWGLRGAEIVRLYETDGYPKMAAQFRTQLKNAGLRRVGVLVDANTDPAARWASIRAMVAGEHALPQAPIAGGFVAPRTTSGKRLGVWMMPDNASRGMMETFLLALRPNDNAPLFAHAERAAQDARAHGAPFAANHEDKALLHTWLAWQDPPGRQLHDAIKQRMLDPGSPYAASFVAWFRALYEV